MKITKDREWRLLKTENEDFHPFSDEKKWTSLRKITKDRGWKLKSKRERGKLIWKCEIEFKTLFKISKPREKKEFGTKKIERIRNQEKKEFGTELGENWTKSLSLLE